MGYRLFVRQICRTNSNVVHLYPSLTTLLLYSIRACANGSIYISSAREVLRGPEWGQEGTPLHFRCGPSMAATEGPRPLTGQLRLHFQACVALRWVCTHRWLERAWGVRRSTRYTFGSYVTALTPLIIGNQVSPQFAFEAKQFIDWCEICEKLIPLSTHTWYYAVVTKIIFTSVLFKSVHIAEFIL